MTGSEPRLHGLFIFRMTGNGLLFKVVAYLLIYQYPSGFVAGERKILFQQEKQEKKYHA